MFGLVFLLASSLLLFVFAAFLPLPPAAAAVVPPGEGHIVNKPKAILYGQ